MNGFERDVTIELTWIAGIIEDIIKINKKKYAKSSFYMWIFTPEFLSYMPPDTNTNGKHSIQPAGGQPTGRIKSRTKTSRSH